MRLVPRGEGIKRRLDHFKIKGGKGGTKKKKRCQESEKIENERFGKGGGEKSSSFIGQGRKVRTRGKRGAVKNQSARFDLKGGGDKSLPCPSGRRERRLSSNGRKKGRPY